MQQLKVESSKRRLNLYNYQLSNKKSRQKSCFIDSNRIDTIKAAKMAEGKKQND